MKKLVLIILNVCMLFEAYSQLPKASVVLKSGSLQTRINVDHAWIIYLRLFLHVL